jgi:SH3 domain-containing YSC84-like protein 1
VSLKMNGKFHLSLVLLILAFLASIVKVPASPLEYVSALNQNPPSGGNGGANTLVQRIQAAGRVLKEMVDTPLPPDIAAKARCVAVIPGYKKGAFLVGGQYGQGVATCRTDTGWSAPVFIQISGASFGLQAGGQSTDLILVGVNAKSLDDLLKNKVKFGGDVAASAGPVGRDSQASTSELASADFLTYSRSKGLFAGVDLTGDELHQNGADTAAFYGKNISFQKILSGDVQSPFSAKQFVSSVSEMFPGRPNRDSKF